MFRKNSLNNIILLTFIFIITGAFTPMVTGKQKLSSEWHALFSDVKKFNEYSKSNTIKLSDALIENYDISGLTITGGNFDDTEWEKVNVTHSNITDSKFVNSTFTEVDFADSILTNVVFQDSEFIGVRFNRGNLKNVKFINSKFSDTTFRSLRLSNIEIIDSDLYRVNFHLSSVKLSANGSNFKKARFIDLKPSSLTFTKSELDVDFSRSKIDKLEITDSELHEPGGGNMTIRELILRGNKGDRIGFDDSNIQRATVEDNNLTTEGIGFVDSFVKDLIVVNGNHSLAVLDAKIEKMKIFNSKLIDFDLDGLITDELRIMNTKIELGSFEKLKAKKLEFENVTIDGKMNFTNAQVDQFINKNTTQTPKAVIDLTGSNIKF